MLDEKINIKELANRMNKSPSAVSMALKQKNISIESLNDICQAMNLNIDINFIKKDDTN
jgi:DNA-binding Xre family transcriptional regulator